MAKKTETKLEMTETLEQEKPAQKQETIPKKRVDTQDLAKMGRAARLAIRNGAEPKEALKNALEAHDVFLLQEDNSPAEVAFCKMHKRVLQGLDV